MKKNDMLNEGTIRRFMKLATIDGLSDKFVAENLEEASEEELEERSMPKRDEDEMREGEEEIEEAKDEDLEEAKDDDEMREGADEDLDEMRGEKEDMDEVSIEEEEIITKPGKVEITPRKRTPPQKAKKEMYTTTPQTELSSKKRVVKPGSLNKDGPIMKTKRKRLVNETEIEEPPKRKVN